MIARPSADEMAPYYHAYCDRVSGEDALGQLEAGLDRVTSTYRSFTPAQLHFRYAPGKWSVQELLGHLTDAERLFGTRALAFARGDRSSLPGFDEDAYVAAARFDERPVANLLEEFTALRRANLAFFAQCPEEFLSRRGTANGQTMSARAVPWVLAGHEQHHLRVLEERYRPLLP